MAKKELKNQTEEVQSESNKIEVGEPLDLSPKSLPLVVKLPKNASSAQVEYAKVLNAYAYINPKKWSGYKDEKTGKWVPGKKDVLIKRLKSLAGKEIATGDAKLSINKSEFSFAFIRTPDGKEILAE